MAATSERALVALDLFAGTGWGVACKRLGIEEQGVELMPEAVATRDANGMKTIYNDVWDGLLDPATMKLISRYTLLIASPPCQTFSAAGKGAGRKALDEVIEAVRLGAYKDPQALLQFGERHDMRTALVLTPLAYIWRDRPELVALEQVPSVLPVWKACAEVMRELGYDVKCAVLSAEQYGVPQTRKRAILVASRVGEAQLPKPTHSRYYSRDPERLDEGVLPWVSMAEALGWTAEGDSWPHLRPAPTVVGTRRSEGGMLIGRQLDDGSRRDVGGRQTSVGLRPGMLPGVRVSGEEAAALQSYPTRLRSNYGTGGDPAARGERTVGQPAATVTSKADRNKWDGDRNLTADEAATLQSYPSSVVFRNGNQANAAKRQLDQPAPTLHFGERSNKVEWMQPDLMGDPSASGVRVTVEKASALQSYPGVLRPEVESWKWLHSPATTIAMDPRITAREHHYHGEQSKTSLRLTQDEAVVLQSYPVEPPFVWCGSKSKVFLQIGNAVPPLLAQRILEALLADWPLAANWSGFASPPAGSADLDLAAVPNIRLSTLPAGAA